MQAVSKGKMKADFDELSGFSDISSEGEKEDYDGPILTLFEHRILNLVGELQACGVTVERIIETLENLRLAPRVIEAATTPFEEFVDENRAVKRDQHGLPVIGEIRRGVRMLSVQTLDGTLIQESTARYLTAAYKVLAYMVGHFSFVEVVKTHWRVFSQPALVIGAVRRTTNARKRRLITTLQATDSGGFGLKMVEHPALAVFDHEIVKTILSQYDISVFGVTNGDILRIVGLLAHIYHFLPVILSEERSSISEHVAFPPMPDPPEVTAVNDLHQQYARYFYMNYFVHGICEPCMFFMVVLREYMLDKKVQVTRSYLRDMSPLYRMYKRVLTMAINTGSEELRAVAMSYQGIKLAQVPGVQAMKMALTSEIYSGLVK